MKKKTFALLLSLVLVFGVVAGGTLAWLTQKTDSVVNTFTYGDINITLDETTGNDYKIIPGVNIKKDPKVTVTAGSEACYLFVKVQEENWPTLTEADGTTKKVSYKIANGWTALEEQTNVYYRVVSAGEAKASVSYNVLAGDTTYPDGVVTVSENLTKTDVNGLKANQPKLTCTAYAVQKDGIADAATAWSKIPTP